ncbi:MAG: hypothetical protein IPJ65_21680 [Archangiaceae bacterium]|nr:hypothetical protein [Archangiaceae bacterium]
MPGKKRETVKETAKKFAQRLAKTVAENDPAKERAFEAYQAEREAAVKKALDAHLARKKK